MSDLRTTLARVARAGRREARDLALDTAYHIDRFHQGRHLPALPPVGRRVVDGLERGEVVAMSVDELDLASTEAMEAAGERILATMRDELARSGRSGEPLIRTCTAISEIRAWATERLLVAIASNYIGLPAAFQGVHARIERVNAAQVTSEQWHRDLEDRRMLKCFFFPAEVTLDHGPFEYVPDSAVGRTSLRAIARATKEATARGELGLTDAQMARLSHRADWRTTTTPPRTIVFADPTASYHHGRLRSLPRESLFFVYTSAFPRHPEHCEQYWNDRYPPA